MGRLGKAGGVSDCGRVRHCCGPSCSRGSRTWIFAIRTAVSCVLSTALRNLDNLQILPSLAKCLYQVCRARPGSLTALPPFDGSCSGCGGSCRGNILWCDKLRQQNDSWAWPCSAQLFQYADDLRAGSGRRLLSVEEDKDRARSGRWTRAGAKASSSTIGSDLSTAATSKALPDLGSRVVQLVGGRRWDAQERQLESPVLGGRAWEPESLA
jgi:hypothetical protein